MNYTEIAAEQIRRDEGSKPYAYQDSEGYWTIGVGILIDKRKNGGLTEEESEFLYQNRLDKAIAAARSLVSNFDRLSHTRRAVLVNMVYQMGRTKVATFLHMLAAIEEERFADAKRAMLDSLWATQTPERAKRLADQMESGDTP